MSLASLRASAAPGAAVILTISKLRWHAPPQRTHHLVAAIAARRPTVFIEAPLAHAGPPHLLTHKPAPGLQVLRPTLMPSAPPAALGALLRRELPRLGITNPVVWTDSPDLLPLACVLPRTGLVLDACTGPPAHAADPSPCEPDVVFAAGPTLYEAWRGHHPRVHFLPNGVDLARFEGRRAGGPRPPVCAGDGPRLVCTTPVGAALDFELLAALADARPGWQFIMAGPLQGASAAALPRRPNLHWLGSRHEAVLPALLAGCQVGLLPLLTGGRTRFLNPVQTLEYLASDLPVVSTPVPDVVMLHGHIVRVAAGAPAWIDACDTALAEGVQGRCRRLMDGARTLSMQSWSRMADRALAAIDGVLAAPAARGVIAAPALDAPHLAHAA